MEEIKISQREVKDLMTYQTIPIIKLTIICEGHNGRITNLPHDE
jgi:hypothetical protein